MEPKTEEETIAELFDNNLNNITTGIKAKSSGVTDEEREKFRLEQVAKARKQNEEKVRQIWDQFDKDGNGELSTEENRQLIKTYLTTCKSWMPNAIQQAAELAVNMMFEKATNLTEAEKAQIRKIVDAKMEKTLPQVHAVAERLLDSLCTDEFADKTMQRMDSDQDGTISKAEFTSKFLDTMDQVRK